VDWEFVEYMMNCCAKWIAWMNVFDFEVSISILFNGRIREEINI